MSPPEFPSGDERGSRPDETDPFRDTTRRRREREPERDADGKLNRDVPEPPNKDDVRPDDDVTPDAGTVEPPD